MHIGEAYLQQQLPGKARLLFQSFSEKSHIRCSGLLARNIDGEYKCVHGS